MKHTKILFALVLLFSMLMLSSCGIRTAKYDFELHGDVVLSPNKAGTYLFGEIECTVTCVSGRDYYEGGNPVDPARAWLIMPDGTKYSAANPAPPEGALVDVKAGDTIKTTLSFSHLPLDFAPGEYDILVSEYDDSTGEGDYSKKLFEKVTVRFGEEAPAETTPAPGVDVQKAVNDYFDWQRPKDYFVVENYEDLQAVYEMASEIPKITDYLMVEGNWRQARKDNTYDQEYFKTGFLIVIMRTSNSMEEKITYNVNRVTDTTIHVTTVSYETVVEHPAAYLTVIPVEGQYKGQEISNVHIHNPLTYD